MHISALSPAKQDILTAMDQSAWHWWTAEELAKVSNTWLILIPFRMAYMKEMDLIERRQDKCDPGSVPQYRITNAGRMAFEEPESHYKMDTDYYTRGMK